MSTKCRATGAEVNTLSIRLSIRRKAELKGIDGNPHKRWSMLFNSKIREEPYLDWHPWQSHRNMMEATGRQVVHGCRQLCRECWLSPITSEPSSLVANIKLRTLTRLPCSLRKVGWLKFIIPYARSTGCATMASTTRSNTAMWSETLKLVPVRIGVCNSTPWRWNRLVIPEFQSVGEYFPGVLHTPSRHGSSVCLSW